MLTTGASIIVLPGAANRDPANVENPERLDVRRRHLKSLIFGAGIHYCVGSALARLELEEALSQLLARIDDLEPMEEPTEWATSPIFRGPQHLRFSFR